MEIPKQLKSRKFWFALVGAVVAFGNAYFEWGLDPEKVWQILSPLFLFIVVEGSADILERIK